MSIDAVGNADHSTANDAYIPGSMRTPKKMLNQDDFFQLLAVQLSSQDPLKPMEDTDFIAQMSNFSSLEMMNKLTGEFDQFNAQQDFASAQNLLGRTVTLAVGDDEVVGIVSAVHTGEDGPLVTVDGTDYAVGSVRRVELTNPATPEN